MAQTKPKAAQFYGVSDNGTDGQFLKTDGAGGMSWDNPITNPTITSIDYPGTATAADPAGGENVIINGTEFISGITCTVGGTSAVTAFNSATQITITTPAKAAGQYTVAVTNTNGGTASQANFIQYSGVPVWSTASGSLGSVTEGASASFQVTATEGSDTIEYSVTTGTLPTGLSLNTNTGAITGTAPSVSADTTTTFSITATDDENQTSSERSFSITVANDNPSNHFNTVLYTGNNTTNIINTVGFEPGLLWVKTRDDNKNHVLVDTARGISSVLEADTTAAAVTGHTDVTSFDTNGFTLGATSAVYMNPAGTDMVAWSFKAGGAAVANTDGTISTQVSANTTSGFSISKYTGNGTSGATFGHGLGSQVNISMVKRTDSTGYWYVYSSFLSANNNLYLNTSDAQQADSVMLGGNTTTVSISASSSVNASGGEYIAYNFASKPGFSKVGTYTGNTSSPPIVSTGFEPAFLIIKAATINDSWFMVDNKRETTNPRGDRLFANSSAAEASEPGAQVNFLSNGFQLTGSGGGAGQTNNNGTTYLYLAIAFAADGSTTTPSLANSFNTTLYNGSSSTPLNVNGIGFKADFSWLKVRNNTWSNGLFSSLMPFGTNNGVKNVYSNNTDAATDLWGTLTWNNNGWTLNGGSYDGSSAHDFGASPYNYVSWNWKAGGLASINTDGTITSLVSVNQAAGFSIVSYTATGSTATVGHGLGTAPDLILAKTSNQAYNWIAYSSALGSSTQLLLDSSNAAQTGSSIMASTNPTSTVFTAGAGNNLNYANGNTIIAYCFTSIPGYSKVGSYTGNGTTGHAISVGFGPNYVLIKRTNNTGNWYIFDSARKTGVYSDQLEANTSGAENTGTYVELTSTGFSLNTTASNLNESGDTFIYLAIKEN